MRIVFLILIIGGCADQPTKPSGSYDATRVVTNYEPSPAFDFAAAVRITFKSESIEVSSDPNPVTESAVTGDQVNFKSGEAWPSPDGAGAANLTYDLQLPDDGTLTGTIRAHVIFDYNGYFDFDYTFSITGAK